MIGSVSSGAYAAANIRSDVSPSNKQEKVQVDASYIPAEITIQTRNPEMSANWDQVREELGYLGPHSRMEEIQSIAQRKMMEGISHRVEAGRRARDIHLEKGDVFGKIAFQKFLSDRQTQIELDAAPKFGIKIDIRIYPPEIEVDTNVRGGTHYF